MIVPSGSGIGPSVPTNPSLITWTFVPPATTPGMPGATVSVAGGSGGAAGAWAKAEKIHNTYRTVNKGRFIFMDTNLELFTVTQEFVGDLKITLLIGVRHVGSIH